MLSQNGGLSHEPFISGLAQISRTYEVRSVRRISRSKDVSSRIWLRGFSSASTGTIHIPGGRCGCLRVCVVDVLVGSISDVGSVSGNDLLTVAVKTLGMKELPSRTTSNLFFLCLQN